MKNALFFLKLKNGVVANTATIGRAFIIALLLSACAGEYQKQTPFTANDAGQVSATSESENAESKDAQEVICRDRVVTGSRFKERICLTKEAWVVLQERDRKKTEQFARDRDSDDVDNLVIDPRTGNPVGLGQVKR